MKKIRKRFLPVTATLLLCLGAGVAVAQPGETEPYSEIEQLYDQLAEPRREDWQRIQGEIERIWSRSGSQSMDLLLERGREALSAEDLDTALHYFSALTDHAPDFAEGWNARATVFYLMEEYSLSIVDIERVLTLNPRHFGALQGLGIMFEQMGEPELSLEAFRAAHALNPHQPELNAAIDRLEKEKGAAEL
jgi:tetratricopeptide (TPR) repeat protein